MAYSKKHAQQNKAIAARAEVLLLQVGWSPETEEFDNSGLWTKLSKRTIAQMDQVTSQIQQEFPDVAENRIGHQVARVMAQARGRASRE